MTFEGLVEPTIIPVKEIAEDQLANYISSGEYRHTPAVLHAIGEQSTQSAAFLAEKRLSIIGQAAADFTRSDMSFIFAPNPDGDERHLADHGLHYDTLEGFIAHNTNKGECVATFMADHGEPYTGPLDKCDRTHMRIRRVVDLWSRDLIDPKLTDTNVYQTRLRAGSMALFMIHNPEPNSEEPRGFWHDFTSLSEDRWSDSTLFQPSKISDRSSKKRQS